MYFLSFFFSILRSLQYTITSAMIYTYTLYCIHIIFVIALAKLKVGPGLDLRNGSIQGYFDRRKVCKKRFYYETDKIGHKVHDERE